MQIRPRYSQAVILDLPGIDTLRDADLSGADLRGANLRSADLRGANLRSADLRSANLTRANLSRANLRSADLRGANLRDANLRDANLRDADLSGADLSYADLRDADLRGDNLRGANLRGAVGAALALARVSHLPSTGSVEGWKKCCAGVLVRLLIPADAARSHGAGRKCRASKAVVLEVLGAEVGVSQYDETFVYRVGETVTPREPWCEDRWDECASGIHFFITREEAEAY